MTSDDELARAATDAADLADRLREAHRALAAAGLNAQARSVLGRRLIALQDTSKHDVAAAAARLDRWEADLAAGRPRPDSA